MGKKMLTEAQIENIEMRTYKVLEKKKLSGGINVKRFFKALLAGMSMFMIAVLLAAVIIYCVFSGYLWGIGIIMFLMALSVGYAMVY